MRILSLALLLEVASLNTPALGQEAHTAKASQPSLRVTLTTEDARQTKIKVEVQTGDVPPKVVRRMEDLLSGTAVLELAGLLDGDYLIFFSSPGYAAQWQTLTLKQGVAEPYSMKLKLFRKRYVVVRYAFNTSGGRKLSGKGVVEGRAAVPHWGSLPYFQQDWQIWQKSSGDDMFGDTPFLNFHRFSKGFGFAKAPEGIPFADLKDAPANTEYKCESMKAEKGLILFCRVEANRKEGLGYGKLLVEDVTERPPAGVKLITSP